MGVENGRDARRVKADSKTLSHGKNVREILALAERAAAGGLKVVPGAEWALHYPANGEARAVRLQQLLDGKCSPEEAASDLKPDGLVYDAGDLATEGLDKVGARINNVAERIKHYDYDRFASFIYGMRGQETDIATLESLYGDIVSTRVQKKLRDSYGATGRRHQNRALETEAKHLLKDLPSSSRAKKVLSTLKLDWLCEDAAIIDQSIRDQAVAGLGGEERQLFEKVREAYQAYVQSGTEAGYAQIVEAVKEGLAKKETPPGESSESMEKLEEELQDYKDEVDMPGTPEDPAIPPEDSDEYHTPPPGPAGESKEKRAERAIFEITPPLGGYYAAGRKSYFDVDKKTWSKKKQLAEYTADIKNGKRHTISATIDGGTKSIPVPTSFALDASSLKYKGAQPKLFRDQNGCFYIKSNGNCEFSVDFVEEAKPFAGQVIAEDTASLHRGQLPSNTEKRLATLGGNNLQKAEQVRQYIFANHFYPGGGDLQMAQALQHKLRSQSTGDNYIQNLNASEYLECYSANTLGIAMLRKNGVPARLVIGHKVEGAKNGKSEITGSTGHAWSEVWDGSTWRRVDFTPQPKPEDKKKEEGEKKESAPEADDNGVEPPQSAKKPDGQQGQKGEGGESGQSGEGEPGGEEGESAEGSEGKPGEGSPGQAADPGQGMGEAGEQEMKDGEAEAEKAAEQMKKAQEQKEKADQAIREAESFKDLKKAKEDLEKSPDLLDDMKERLEEQLKKKEEAMKRELQEKLEKMDEDGFLDEKQKDALEKAIEEGKLEELDKMEKQLEQESALYESYDAIREEVQPLVDQWYKYFAERLPRQENPDVDEDSLARRGVSSRRGINRARNVLFGITKNPRVFKPEIKPKFLASFMLDVSGSMAGRKLADARKMLIFFCELISRISQEFGYIRFSINLFSDAVTEVKKFDQQYDSRERYTFSGGETATVKLRLMKALMTSGGTNMLDAIKQASQELNDETFEYPDYASALYFFGDGDDTCGNSARIRDFVSTNKEEGGFGRHMVNAFMLGDESQRQALAGIFGDEQTGVADNFEDLIEESMGRLDQDMEAYIKDAGLG